MSHYDVSTGEISTHASRVGRFYLYNLLTHYAEDISIHVFSVGHINVIVRWGQTAPLFQPMCHT